MFRHASSFGQSVLLVNDDMVPRLRSSLHLRQLACKLVPLDVTPGRRTLSGLC